MAAPAHAGFAPSAGEPPLKYLAGYPSALLDQVRTALVAGRVGPMLAQRYPERHELRSERALYDYVSAIKAEYLRSAEPISKVAWDPKLHIIRNALGTHTAVSRVQGGKLKAKREIRIAALFKDAPAAFLRMIVVHELAHLRQREHDRAFYALCCHMEPDYHQIEFDLRVWLTLRELAPAEQPGG